MAAKVGRPLSFLSLVKAVLTTYRGCKTEGGVISRARRTQKRNELVGAFQGPVRYTIKNVRLEGAVAACKFQSSQSDPAKVG